MMLANNASMQSLSTRAALILSIFLLSGCTSITSAFLAPASSSKRQHRVLLHQANQAESTSSTTPSLIVLDLDGNLWRPEMYELQWDGSGHAPFTPIPNNKDGTVTKVKSQLGTVVKLIGDVAELLDDNTIPLAISSRTDVPEWATELLDKFTLRSGKTLAQVITGPWEISYDRKVTHFHRLSKKLDIPLEHMVFFDNEAGNCRSIAQLGVTVGYCPQGVTRSVWDRCMAAFPNTDGSVIGM